MGRKPSYNRLFPALLLTSPKSTTLRRLTSADGPHDLHALIDDHHEEESERCPKRRSWSPALRFRKSCSSEDMLLTRDSAEKAVIPDPPLLSADGRRHSFPEASTEASTSTGVAPSIVSLKLSSNISHHRRGQSEPTYNHTERKSVRFGKCIVRSYSQVLGDHPCCATGCPLTLGWDYQEESVTPVVDDYDLESIAAAGCKKSRSELRLTWDERRAILSSVSDANIRRHCRQWQREQGGMKRLQQRVERDFFRHVQEEDVPGRCLAETGTARQLFATDDVETSDQCKETTVSSLVESYSVEKKQA